MREHIELDLRRLRDRVDVLRAGMVARDAMQARADAVRAREIDLLRADTDLACAETRLDLRLAYIAGRLSSERTVLLELRAFAEHRLKILRHLLDRARDEQARVSGETPDPVRASHENLQRARDAFEDAGGARANNHPRTKRRPGSSPAVTP